jgi:IS30 family transposase
MAPRLTAEQQREIWDRLAAGESMRSIARSIHKGQATVRDLIATSGGIRPVIPSRCSELRLSLVEREEISRGLARGESARQIAEHLGRAPSTISREIARNGGANYRACDAEALARRRARRPKRAKLARCRRLRAVVEAKLAASA